MSRTLDPANCLEPQERAVRGFRRGGEHWAVVASLIETCKLIGIDPQAYLANEITQIVDGHPNSRANNLLPWVYLPAHALDAVV